MARSVQKEFVMQFRWIVFLALWTALSGPILARPGAGEHANARQFRSEPTHQSGIRESKSPSVSCHPRTVR
jgi:hypothetical protein